MRVFSQLISHGMTLTYGFLADGVTARFDLCINILQEFLDILRWNDGNYWSIKESSDKNHKRLFKFIRRYKVDTQSEFVTLM